LDNVNAVGGPFPWRSFPGGGFAEVVGRRQLIGQSGRYGGRRDLLLRSGLSITLLVLQLSVG